MNQTVSGESWGENSCLSRQHRLLGPRRDRARERRALCGRTADGAGSGTWRRLARRTSTCASAGVTPRAAIGSALPPLEPRAPELASGQGALGHERNLRVCRDRRSGLSQKGRGRGHIRTEHRLRERICGRTAPRDANWKPRTPYSSCLPPRRQEQDPRARHSTEAAGGRPPAGAPKSSVAKQFGHSAEWGSVERCGRAPSGTSRSSLLREGRRTPSPRRRGR